MAESIESIITVYKAEVSGYVKEIDEIIKKVRQLTGIEDQQKQNAIVGARSLTDAASQRKKILNDEVANLKKLQEQSKKAFTVPEVQSFNSQIAQSKSNIALLGGETQKLNPLMAGLKSQFVQVGAGILAAFSVQALISFGREAINVSAQFNSIRNALNFVQGSAEKGGEAFEFLRKLSDDLGLELVSTSQAFKLFSASAQLAGISSDETREIFTNVSTAVTALGLSADDAQGVFLALSQVISKGTVAAEELRGQIGERLPGAFELAAKSMGVTTKELNKMLEQGQVLSKDFLPAFSKTLKATFEGALPEAVKSARANLNRLSNAFTELQVSAGDKLNAVLGGLFDLFGSFGNQTDDIVASFEKQATSVKILEQSINPLIERYDQLKLQGSLNKDEQNELNDIILQIGKSLPGTVTEFDKYGNALDINRGKVTGFLKEQAGFTQVKEREAIKALISDAENAAKFIELITRNINTASREAIKFTGTTAGITQFLEESQTKLAQTQSKLLEINDKLKKDFSTDLPDALKKYLDAAKGAAFETRNIGALLADLDISDVQRFFDAFNSETLRETTVEIIAQRKAIEDLKKEQASPIKIEEAQKKLKELLDAAPFIKLTKEQIKAQEDFNKIDVGLAKMSSEQKISILSKEIQQRNALEENSLAKLRLKLKKFQDELENIKLNTANEPDPAQLDRILSDIEKTQKAIDAITGKSNEERIKQAEETRKKLIDEEKKIVDAINKIRIELAPTEEQKILIKAEIDRESLNQAADDFRSIAEIQKSIDTEKINFLRLNALKLLSDLAAIDKKRNEDLTKAVDEQVQSSLDARQKQLQQDLKNAQDEIAFTEELENELNRAKISLLKEGSEEELKFKKDILEKKAAQEIIANLGNAKKIQEIETRLQNDLNDLDKEFARQRVENFKQTFQEIADIASQFVNAFADFERAKSDAVIENLERQNEVQQEAFDKETEALEDARDKRLISEKEYETRSNAIKEQRIASEKKIGDAIRAEKRKQAEISKSIAIFEATINLAQAIVTALTAGPVIGIVIAALTAALGAVQLALIISTPVPTFATGTKDKKESGMAIVGERGQELVHLPSASQVLPAPQTRKNREVINAMFDNKLPEYIQKKYVAPEIAKEKLSTQKKYEILKQVYEKQAVDNYNKSVIEKYELTRTNAIKNIVNNYLKNIVSNEQINLITDKKVFDTIVKRKDELSQILNENKISFSSDKKESMLSEIKNSEISESNKKELTKKVNEVLSSTATFKELRETVNKISKQYEQTDVHNLLNNIQNRIENFANYKESVMKNVYDNRFEKSINTNYVSAALEQNRAKVESKKQEAFAQNIANSFMLQNQTNFDNEKIQSAVENGFMAATKRGLFLRNYKQLAEAIAEENKPDYRKM